MDGSSGLHGWRTEVPVCARCGCAFGFPMRLMGVVDSSWLADGSSLVCTMWVRIRFSNAHDGSSGLPLACGQKFSCVHDVGAHLLRFDSIFSRRGYALLCSFLLAGGSHGCHAYFVSFFLALRGSDPWARRGPAGGSCPPAEPRRCSGSMTSLPS